MGGGGYFKKTPLSPPGSKVVIHKKMGQQIYWGPYGVEGRYSGPSMEHYILHTVYVNKIIDERIVDTVEFFPEKN